MVAIPLIRCITFSIRRSVWSNDCTLPSTIIATSPGFTSAPSLINTSTFIVGSKRLKISFATSIPASTPASFINSFDFPISVSGMHESVVWSPSPISSAKARSISLSINSFSLFICLIYSYLMYHILFFRLLQETIHTILTVVCFQRTDNKTRLIALPLMIDIKPVDLILREEVLHHCDGFLLVHIGGIGGKYQIDFIAHVFAQLLRATLAQRRNYPRRYFLSHEQRKKQK